MRARAAAHSGPVTYLIAGLVVLAALVLSGLGTVTVDWLSLRVPQNSQVALLPPGRRACEGPLTSAHPIDRATVFGGAVLPPSRARIEVFDGSDRPAAAGSFSAGPTATARTVVLDRSVGASTHLRVCVVSTLNTFSLLGSTPVQPGINMGPHRRDLAFSLTLGAGGSLLGHLPLVFSRASVFKLSWVGPWTYWLLLGLVLGALALGALAVGAAQASDAADL